ncbi:MAG: hypothetical protein NVSMB33_10620 [Ktedonobacteraceae bacterium]
MLPPYFRNTNNETMWEQRMLLLQWPTRLNGKNTTSDILSDYYVFDVVQITGKYIIRVRSSKHL